MDSVDIAREGSFAPDDGMVVKLSLYIDSAGDVMVRGETSTNSTVEPLRYLVGRAMDHVADAAQRAITEASR